MENNTVFRSEKEELELPMVRIEGELLVLLQESKGTRKMSRLHFEIWFHCSDYLNTRFFSFQIDLSLYVRTVNITPILSFALDRTFIDDHFIFISYPHQFID